VNQVMILLVASQFSHSAGRIQSRGFRAVLLALALGVYTLTLVAGPFLHHDFACHTRSRTHCTSCVLDASVSPLSNASCAHVVAPSETGATARQADAGLNSADLFRSHGRSPPA
jgi:hypothetical protein